MNTTDTALTQLHETYVVAVNSAVEHDDLRLADELAAEYDREVAALQAA